MSTHSARFAGFAERTRESFARQRWMASLGAQLTHVAPGEVHIEMPGSPQWSQQHGYLHAGAITSIVDSACGYAALTLMPEGFEVLTVEFKVNLLSPAIGPRFRAVGRVLRAGRTISVCSGEVLALDGQGPKTVALMQATMMAMKAG